MVCPVFLLQEEDIFESIMRDTMCKAFQAPGKKLTMRFFGISFL